MNIDFSTLSPPVRLAMAYARTDLRAALGMLLVFDDRLASVIGRGSEPIFAQMKIAWWQDALAKSADLRPQGEPLLAGLRQLEDAEQAAGVIPAMQLLLDAWGVLAASEPWTPDILQEFAEARSKAVFETYAVWVATDETVAGLGRRWAVDDLSDRFGELFGKGEGALFNGTHRRLRPLSILALSARPDVSGARLIWHALTGR